MSSRSGHRRALLAGCVALLLLACDEPVQRGPRTEPVQNVSMGWIDGPRLPVETLSRDELAQQLAQLQAHWEKSTEQSKEQGLRIHWLPADPGAELATSDVLLVRLPADHFSPRLLSPAPASTRFDLDARGVLDEAQVLLGSAFVAGFSPLLPLGLMQVDGAIISELQPHGYTRILGIRPDALGVVHRGAFHRGLFDSALQVGPGIIERGVLDINAGETRLPAFLRSFVGVCEDEYMLGVSLQPTHLYDLGRRLLQTFDEVGLACDEVANLSGDRETLLVLPIGGGRSLAIGDLEAPKTALLGFTTAP